MGTLCAAVAIVFACDAAAYKQHINVTREATEATGSNTVVVQVEAPSADKSGKMSSRNYAPDSANANFRSVDIKLPTDAEVSAHSDTVAQLYFGSKRSIAAGIRTAHVYSTTQWLRALGKWNLNADTAPEVFPGPVVNHSWVMNARRAPQILRRVDYSAETRNVLHVAGVKRSGAGASLLAGGYNTLVVGSAVKNIVEPYAVLDEFYGEGRTRPHLVGPYPHASAAAPIVAAAAVRLNALALKEGIQFPNPGDDRAEQLPVALIRAVLMASASTDFDYSTKGKDYVNAFGTLGVTENGLDKRYGMGMLNVDAAEHVLLATPKGVQSGGSAAGRGFAYTSHTAGTESRFRLKPRRGGALVVTLSWLAEVFREGDELKGRLDDFDVALVQVNQGGASQATPVPVARSASTIDSTENMRVRVEAGVSYELVVTRKNNGPERPFALAWNVRR